LTIRRILVAVDGSKPSVDASVQAIDISKRLNAEMTAIYVVSPDIRYNYLEDTITPRLPRALKDVMMIAMQTGEKHLDKVKQKAREKEIKRKKGIKDS